MLITAIHPIKEIQQDTAIPMALSRISAGFPSPADDHLDAHLDLNSLLVEHPTSTFFVRVDGESMKGAGIRTGDVLVVDRALEPKPGDVVLAVLGGEFTVKRWIRSRGSWLLQAENPDYPDIPVGPETDFEIWGVVSFAIHDLRCSP